MDLKLYIRQSAQVDRLGQQVYYEGNNPQTLHKINGQMPVGNPRRWRDYLSYIDVTNNCSDLFKLKLTWTTEINNSGQVTPGATNQKKSASGTISFEGEAYRLIKAWLIEDVSAPLNTVDVQIEHVGCGIYDNYQIKSTDLSWCETDVCQFDTIIKQKDEPLNCIKRTMIDNNWQQWFQKVPGNGKKHPRFSYCNEIRPNGQLVVQWFNMAVLTVFLISFMAPFIFAYNSIIFIIATIVNTINAIISFLNALGLNINPIPFDPDPITLDDIRTSWGQMFIETAGCGREHPAVLVRDYITNVCDYCGVRVDDVSAPIFFKQYWEIQTSDPNRGDNGIIQVDNPHYYVCVQYATNKRGIRRFGNFGIGALFGKTDPNTTEFWIPENSPLKTLDIFLDELKPIYNYEWRVKSYLQNGQYIPYLEIQRKDWFRNRPGEYVYDFTGPDKPKIVEGVCFEWNEKKNPAYIQGIYNVDPADTCGNEARGQMNSTLSLGNIDDNPTLEGSLDKTQNFFGATKFRLDGASTDYIFDAMQVVANSQFLTGFMAGFVKDFIYPDVEKYGDYAQLLKDETFTLPKLLIWDNNKGYINARAVQGYKAESTLGSVPMINTKYNPMGNQWDSIHEPETFVIGSSLTLGSSPAGKYTVQDFFGIIIAQKDAMLVNWPMYFDVGFYDTLWDWFHFIDDPLANPLLNQNWRLKIQLCCEDLQKLKPFGDVSQIELLEKVKLPTKYYQDGVMTEITVSYDPSDELGQYIEIKGTV